MINRWPVIALSLVVVLLAFAHAPAPLRLIYPALAIALGLYLEATDFSAYVAFVLWVWALSPLVRRVADFQAGWQDPSLIILTPYLVTALCVVQLIVRTVVLQTRKFPFPYGRMVFWLAGAGVAIGVPIGLIAQPSAAMLEGLNWLLPPAFGWCLASATHRQLLVIERTLARTFLEIGVVTGAYGIYQFVNPLPWDVEWMRNVEMSSIGVPEPFGVRVFGTMHSPGVLSLFLVVPLTIWLAKPRLAGIPAVCLASTALLMSQVRAAWIGLVVSAVLVVACLPGRARVRALLLLPVAGFLVVYFVSSPDVQEVTSRRFATFSDPSGDGSAMSRLSGHRAALGFAADHPLGGGIGFSDARLEEFIGMRDSIIVAALVQFGMVGATLYVIGFVGLTVLIWGYFQSAVSAERLGLACAGIGLLSTALLGTTTAGPPGVVVWAIAGLAASARARSVPLTSAPPGRAVTAAALDRMAVPWMGR